MKYIRTKDGRIIDTEQGWTISPLYDGTEKTKEYYQRHRYVQNGDCTTITQENFTSDDIIKQSDTIEELFDEFRGIWINYYESEKKDAHEEYHYDKEKNVFYDDFEELTPKATIEKFDIFYGSLWTDKGLIYKAKMKGVLPNGEIDWELL